MSHFHSLTRTGIARGKLALGLFALLAIVALLGIGPVQSLVAGPQAAPVVTLTSPVSNETFIFNWADPLVIAGTTTGKISQKATVEVYDGSTGDPLGGGNVTSSNGTWYVDIYPPHVGLYVIPPWNTGWNELEIIYSDGKVSAHWWVDVYLYP